MKLNLRTLALAATVAATGAIFAQETVTPTITKKWAVEGLKPEGFVKGDYRFGTGYDGTVYTINKAGKAIVPITAAGIGTPIVLSDYALGTGISSDDAGNLLINLGFPGPTSSTDFIIYTKDGQVKPLTLTVPEGCEAARMDQIGRVVGDMMSEEGAAFYNTPNAWTGVWTVGIKNGEPVTFNDLDYVVTEPIGTPLINTSTVAQPMLSYQEMLEYDPAEEVINQFYIRNRGNKSIYSFSTGESVAMPQPANSNSQEGFDVFTLGGETYQVMPTKASANYEPTFVIAKADGTVVYTSDYTVLGDGGQSFGSFVARKVSDYKVEVYQYFAAGSGINACMVEVTIPEPAPLYITGDCTTPTWNPNQAEQFTYADGKYTYEATFKSLGGFKISTNKGPWDGTGSFNEGVLGVANGATILKVGQTYNLQKGMSGDLKLEKGKYTLTIDAATMALTVTGEAEVVIPDFYVRGDWNSWEANDASMMARTEGEGGKYVYTKHFDEFEGTFKIGDKNWGLAFGMDETTPTISGSGTYNMWLTTDGGNQNCDKLFDVTFTFTYDPANPEPSTLVVEAKGTVGIEGIATEEAPAEYYNLQGLRVSAPAAGQLYIVRQGGKTFKTFVK